MAANPKQRPFPLGGLPSVLRQEGAISLDVEEGLVVLRASKPVAARIQLLLQKNASSELTAAEKNELDQFEELDYYLSLLNRLSRNLATADSQAEAPGAP